MIIRMDDVRRDLAMRYSDFIVSIEKLLKDYSFPKDEKEEVEDEALSLRQSIAILHCISNDKEDGFTDLSEKIESNEYLRELKL